MTDTKLKTVIRGGESPIKGQRTINARFIRIDYDPTDFYDDDKLTVKGNPEEGK